MSAPTLRSEINVTPLVDVCLVLLIVFMIVTPLCVHQAGLELPQATRVAPIPETATQLTLGADGRLLLNATAVAREALPAALAELRATGHRLAIRADRRLPYREVRALLAAASAAEFPGAELVVDRRRAP